MYKNSMDSDELLEPKYTILVVNDNIQLLNMLSNMLEGNFNVHTAANGLEGYDLLISHAKHYFDAIVLDINMPIMDGFEACHKMKAFLTSTSVLGRSPRDLLI